MRHRERQIGPHYLSHAQRLDRDHSAPGTTPIEQRLRSFTTTRGLVYGNYGEASADVHDLIRTAARRMADQRWRAEGARSSSELYSFIACRCYRRVGMRVVQAFARHRLQRVPYVGAPRAVVVARPPRRAVTRQLPADASYEFYAYQTGPMAAPA